MKKNILNSPPSWQKDAIPTPLGWKHPRSGELLVSVRLDMSQFEKTEDIPSNEEILQLAKETRKDFYESMDKVLKDMPKPAKAPRKKKTDDQ